MQLQICVIIEQVIVYAMLNHSITESSRNYSESEIQKQVLIKEVKNKGRFLLLRDPETWQRDIVIIYHDRRLYTLPLKGL
jgi:hypothetical protein